MIMTFFQYYDKLYIGESLYCAQPQHIIFRYTLTLNIFFIKNIKIILIDVTIFFLLIFFMCECVSKCNALDCVQPKLSLYIDGYMTKEIT
jgi:hypothetical protein